MTLLNPCMKFLAKRLLLKHHQGNILKNKSTPDSVGKKRKSLESTKTESANKIIINDSSADEDFSPVKGHHRTRTNVLSLQAKNPRKSKKKPSFFKRYFLTVVIIGIPNKNRK